MLVNRSALAVALTLPLLLAVGYTIFIHIRFSGKVTVETDGY